jgi:hypothetical protein
MGERTPCPHLSVLIPKSEEFTFPRSTNGELWGTIGVTHTTLKQHETNREP